jgi:hypothetical protein
MYRSCSLLALVLCAAPAGAQSPSFRVSCPNVNTGFGDALDRFGDVDGDGVPDLVVGLPNDSSAGFQLGSAQLISGSNGSVIRTLPGSGGHFGAAVADAGDVDGDGIDDVVIGAYQDSTGGNASGCARVYSGATGALLWTFPGNTLSYFGWSVAGAGDVDHDGHADILVSGYLDSTGGSNAGRVVIFSGATGAPLVTVLGAAGEYIGNSVASIGDVNADGTDDFAIGSPLAANYFGRVRIHSGVNGAVLRTLVGPTQHEGFGACVARSGDVNLDGTPDLAVGAYFVSGGTSGHAFLYSGATGALLRSYAGDLVGDSFGSALSGVLDVDGDGVPDLAVGAGDYNFSNLGGYARAFSGATGQVLDEVRGPLGDGPVMLIRMRALLARDVNADGHAEFVVSIPGAPGESHSHGDLRLYTNATPQAVGSGFCFGDGSGTPCPCGNNGASGGGCANSTGTGAVLDAFGTSSASADDAWFEGHDLPAGVTTILFSGNQQAGGGAGLALYDGLRCVGGTLHRLGTRAASTTGIVHHPSGLRAFGGWSAGTTVYFQLQYRNVGGPCAHGSNFSNGLSVTFGP